MAWKEFDHTTIDYVLHYGGRCRECADHHGLCPNGLPCDVDDAKTAIRWVLKALNYGIANGFVVAPPSPAQGTEPVAWTSQGNLDGLRKEPRQSWSIWGEKSGLINVPLYASPPDALKAAKRLLDKIDAIHEDERFKSVWAIAHLHIRPYTGPQYADELAALRAALSAGSQGALERRNAIAAAIFDPGATEGFKGDRTLTEWQTDAVMRVISG